MNSFNHYAYGEIGDWLYRVVYLHETFIELSSYLHAACGHGWYDFFYRRV